MIQAIVCSSVPRSGAITSWRGPMMVSTSSVKRRVRRSSSPRVRAGGIEGDAALGSAEGQVHDAALPRHPHGQGRHFAEVHGGMVAQAALGRSAGEAVLDAVADEDFGTAIVHAHGNADDHGPLGLAEANADIGVEVDGFGDLVELPQGHLEGRGVLENRDGSVGTVVGSVGDRRSAVTGGRRVGCLCSGGHCVSSVGWGGEKSISGLYYIILRRRPPS